MAKANLNKGAYVEFPKELKPTPKEFKKQKPQQMTKVKTNK